MFILTMLYEKYVPGTAFSLSRDPGWHRHCYRLCAGPRQTGLPARERTYLSQGEYS